MSILSDRAYLELCQQLAQLNVRPSFDVGESIARGFADLGFEEFCVLPGPRILSLLAGTITPLPHEDRGRFILVPTVDQLISLIDSSGGDIHALNFVDRRMWKLQIAVDAAPEEIEHSSLKVTLMLGLLAVLRSR